MYYINYKKSIMFLIHVEFTAQAVVIIEHFSYQDIRFDMFKTVSTINVYYTYKMYGN